MVDQCRPGRGIITQLLDMTRVERNPYVTRKDMQIEINYTML